MSLKSLHAYLGQLLDAGVNPDLPVVSLADGWPCEIAEVQCLLGKYKGDPAPKLSAFVSREGMMVALIPVGEDSADLVNDYSHEVVELPVEPSSPI